MRQKCTSFVRQNNVQDIHQTNWSTTAGNLLPYRAVNGTQLLQHVLLSIMQDALTVMWQLDKHQRTHSSASELLLHHQHC